ncbi:MAG: hypothetical protein ACI9YU_000914 [Flavobacteriales bacterium]|jgi:hypothetical protein
MIMRNTFINLLIGSLLLSTVGCKDFLDLDPVSQIPGDMAITSERDLQNLVVSMYNGIQSGSLYGSDLQLYGDLMVDDTQVEESQLSNFGTREIYQRASSIQLGLLRSTWSTAYRQINAANTVIRTIDHNVLGEALAPNKKDQFRAEALFIRAFCHFELVRFWALPYNVDARGSNDQMGIPYRTEATVSLDQDFNLARHSVEQVYRMALQDLDQAEAFFVLAGMTSSIHRSSERAANALKARIKFMSGDYIGASTEADKVINDNQFTLFDSADGDPLLIPFQTEGFKRPRQVIFQLVFTTFDHGLSGPYSQLNNLPVFKSADNDFAASFNPNDQRLTKWFLRNPLTGKARIKKYDKPQEVEFRNLPVIRLAEMHLIRAEANMSPGGNGNGSDALESYNLVRKRAFGTNHIEETSTNQLLEKIQFERRWEMCFENDRYHNAKRMKANLRDDVLYNDASLIFKIPQEEIAGNDLIIQNP